MSEPLRATRDISIETTENASVVHILCASQTRSLVAMIPLVVFGVALAISGFAFLAGLFDSRAIGGQMRTGGAVVFLLSALGLYGTRRFATKKTQRKIVVSDSGVEIDSKLYAREDIEGIGWEKSGSWSAVFYRVYLEFGDRRITAADGLTEQQIEKAHQALKEALEAHSVG